VGFRDPAMRGSIMDQAERLAAFRGLSLSGVEVED
jgi:hypothetical protein